jgi:beta-N-acetylhexosaminidase
LGVARRGAQSGRKQHRGLPTLIVVAILVSALVGCTGVSQRDREPPPENDPKVERGIGGRSAEVDQMSLRDMVGQMFMISIGGTEPDYYVNKMIRERNIGGVLLFGYNMESEAQTAALTGSLQELSMETEPSIPLFIAVDQEGGEISHAPWVAPQPAAARVGARGDPAEARAIAEEMGRELLEAGVNTDLAPVVDTGFGAAIGARSFGEDPRLVAEMGAAAVEGFEAAGIVCAAKHFPNHGAATSDSHKSLPVVDHDPATLRSRDLPPFEAAIEAGVPMVMVGHLLYPAVDPERPASLSPEAVGMLRGELGFDGVVVTDDLAMAAASGDGPPARAAVEAVKAGADLLIISSPPQQQADAYEAVLGAVESGEIPRERIQDSVARILKVKGEYSLAR